MDLTAKLPRRRRFWRNGVLLVLAAGLGATLYAGPSRRSQIVLGLIPGATAKAPLPACGTIAGEPCRRNTSPVPAGRLSIGR
jgi:hypothetical protein